MYKPFKSVVQCRVNFSPGRWLFLELLTWTSKLLSLVATMMGWTIETRYCVELFDWWCDVLLVCRCSNTIHPTTPGPRLGAWRDAEPATQSLKSTSSFCAARWLAHILILIYMTLTCDNYRFNHLYPNVKSFKTETICRLMSKQYKAKPIAMEGSTF